MFTHHSKVSMQSPISPRILSKAEVLTITLLALLPLCITFPYRVNIFLTWEGAYRMSEGQIPFRDFGIPSGGVYWVIPALFFKLFGPKMITLIKAQVFINIIAGFSFRSILSSLAVKPVVRFIAVLFFCISYSFFNFWPWYNHTVIVYEFVAIAFLFRFFSSPFPKKISVYVILAAFFTVCSFLTKQDGGGMAFGICILLLFYQSIQEKKWFALAVYVVSFSLMIALFAFAFSSFGFAYWFNHGQPPHTARISLMEISDEILTSSQWIKFYFFLIVLLLAFRYRKWKEMFYDRIGMLFILLVLGILAEAAVLQISSYTPPDNNIFFHSFAFAFILTLLGQILPGPLETSRTLFICITGTLFFWSGSFWKYIQRTTGLFYLPATETHSKTGENVVNRNTYILTADTADAEGKEPWVLSGLKSFDKIYMPKGTSDGMHRVLSMDLIKKGTGLRVLNMSELTPLAAEMPFSLEKNSDLPLWYHLGVGMFNRQAGIFEDRIKRNYYDLVLFEYVPTLNNFYPFRTRDSLKLYYKMVDSFPAPRRGETKGIIEVYTKP